MTDIKVELVGILSRHRRDLRRATMLSRVKNFDAPMRCEDREPIM